ncbi:hypothetical protein [Rickettsia canadensis]
MQKMCSAVVLSPYKYNLKWSCFICYYY